MKSCKNSTFLYKFKDSNLLLSQSLRLFNLFVEHILTGTLSYFNYHFDDEFTKNH